jgi:catechol 2,3-dioxygenase-like lactoylglutathione lyase family enzyme
VRILVALALGAAFFCSSAGAFENAFWVWQRSEPLSDVDRTELSAQGVRTIYWQTGELENVGETWRWKARFAVPPSGGSELRFVPVVRLESREKSPFTKTSLDALLSALSPVTNGAGELQLDYDAPDRLIGDYAAALKRIHSLVPKLTITALPGWSRPATLRALEPSVDELLPMLYDFEPDPVVEGAAPLPLLVPEKLEKALTEWNQCRIPWRAGLPAFARVTLFDPSGKSRGHIREWNWDDLCFNKALVALRPAALGLTVFQLRSPTRVTNTPIRADQLIAVRWPDRSALIRVIEQVKKTSAAGLVFFRLPDSSAPSGWSLRQLGHLDAVSRLVLKKTGTPPQLELVNESDADLEPRLSSAKSTGDLDRGYALELDAAAPIFRDAQEGDFWRLLGHVDPDGARQPVAFPLATRLTFWFSHLRARQSWRTGVIQLAPGENFSQIRYRVRNATGDSEWKNIDD